MKDDNDGAARTVSGKSFHARGPATGNERSPTVINRDRGVWTPLVRLDRCRVADKYGGTRDLLVWDMPYTTALQIFNLDSLHSRRVKQGMKFFDSICQTESCLNHLLPSKRQGRRNDFNIGGGGELSPSTPPEEEVRRCYPRKHFEILLCCR